MDLVAPKLLSVVASYQAVEGMEDCCRLRSEVEVRKLTDGMEFTTSKNLTISSSTRMQAPSCCLKK